MGSTADGNEKQIWLPQAVCHRAGDKTEGLDIGEHREKICREPTLFSSRCLLFLCKKSTNF